MTRRPISSGAFIFADDDLQIADERTPGPSNSSGLRRDAARDLTQPPGSFDHTPGERVIAVIRQFNHHLAGRSGNLVGEFRRRKLVATTGGDRGEEFFAVSRKARELLGVGVMSHGEANSTIGGKFRIVLSVIFCTTRDILPLSSPDVCVDYQSLEMAGNRRWPARCGEMASGDVSTSAALTSSPYLILHYGQWLICHRSRETRIDAIELKQTGDETTVRSNPLEADDRPSVRV